VTYKILLAKFVRFRYSQCAGMKQYIVRSIQHIDLSRSLNTTYYTLS